MIGTKYTSGLLAELAKTPHVRSMGIPTTPNGQWVSSVTRRYADDRECKTTLFDVGDAELVSVTADFNEDSTRFGFTLSRDVEKVAVPEDGLDKRIVVFRRRDLGRAVAGHRRA